MDQPLARTADRGRRAVVIGASMAGLLAATALADEADEVLLVDRDTLPDEPVPRTGLPQARHAHLLWSGGAHVIEQLAPGLQDRWLAAGARRVTVPTDFIILTPHGWMRRTPAFPHYQILCSRDLLDAVARKHLLTHPRITVCTGIHAESLIGDRHRAHGVRLRELSSQTLRTVTADLVVDATGRGSRAPHWLAGLGLPPVREIRVDAGLVYATRIFRAPPGGDACPVIALQADPAQSTPGRIASLIPIEGGRWLVTLAGTFGGQPTADSAEFEPFARSAPHPIVADLISAAEPLTNVSLTRSCSNQRRFYERLRPWPSGFVVLGDAVAAYNPIYGQGMSVAAHSVGALRRAVRRHGLASPRLARAAQRAIGRIVANPWEITVNQDIRFPGARGRRPSVAARLSHGYVDRLSRTATDQSSVACALFDLMSLSSPPNVLFHPRTVLKVLRGPRRSPLADPPLTPAEQALRHSPSTPAPPTTCA
ncbi:NAD(P)/FAD-dependent oxidoreductase [Streptomyces sp. NPDC059009]|uniref:NAD(P)/FAD-dependent oxidoreductase n=1 Tax=Streptomyces sp. NPDC059009 TaxID=3346694 RepID=UPI0036A1BE31